MIFRPVMKKPAGPAFTRTPAQWIAYEQFVLKYKSAFWRIAARTRGEYEPDDIESEALVLAAKLAETRGIQIQFDDAGYLDMLLGRLHQRLINLTRWPTHSQVMLAAIHWHCCLTVNPVFVKKKSLIYKDFLNFTGGAGGIRTRGGFYPTHAFQACDLNHSSTAPAPSILTRLWGSFRWCHQFSHRLPTWPARTLGACAGSTAFLG